MFYAVLPNYRMNWPKGTGKTGKKDAGRVEFMDRGDRVWKERTGDKEMEEREVWLGLRRGRGRRLKAGGRTGWESRKRKMKRRR